MGGNHHGLVWQEEGEAEGCTQAPEAKWTATSCREAGPKAEALVPRPITESTTRSCTEDSPDATAERSEAADSPAASY